MVGSVLLKLWMLIGEWSRDDLIVLFVAKVFLPGLEITFVHWEERIKR
jgi:hypothetical protein